MLLAIFIVLLTIIILAILFIRNMWLTNNNTYKYFYDSKLKDEVTSQAKKLKMDIDDVKDSLKVTKSKL